MIRRVLLVAVVLLLALSSTAQAQDVKPPLVRAACTVEHPCSDSFLVADRASWRSPQVLSGENIVVWLRARGTALELVGSNCRTVWGGGGIAALMNTCGERFRVRLRVANLGRRPVRVFVRYGVL